MPVLALVGGTGWFAGQERLINVVALLTVLLVSALVYHFIEKPILRLRTWPEHQPLSGAVVPR